MSALEVYRKTRKVPDLFWNARVCRPLGAVIVDAIQGTRVTPNQITLAALLVAGAAAVLFFGFRSYLGLVLAIVV
jgi:hypothetical protein